MLNSMEFSHLRHDYQQHEVSVFYFIERSWIDNETSRRNCWSLLLCDIRFVTVRPEQMERSYHSCDNPYQGWCHGWLSWVENKSTSGKLEFICHNHSEGRQTVHHEALLQSMCWVNNLNVIETRGKKHNGRPASQIDPKLDVDLCLIS